MSEENVEVVRLAYDYVSTGQDAVTVLAIYDPEIEWDISLAPARHLLGEPHVFRGHNGLKKFFRAWYEAWEVVKPDLEELIDEGDRVIAIETTRGRGRASGLSVELPHVSVWTIREGKIIRVQWFATRDEAREATGLPE
jgi:ketosteroid isomerase-like protein